MTTLLASMATKRRLGYNLGCNLVQGDAMKKPEKYGYHPICLLFPPLGKEELLELADDIRAKGLLEDIVLFEGKFLDGRNRLAACKIAKVKPTFVQWKGKGSPLDWVISENLIRRHLTSRQKGRDRSRPFATPGEGSQETPDLSTKMC